MSAPRLEQGTQLNQPNNGAGFSPDDPFVQKLVTVRNYGEGIVEVGYAPARQQSIAKKKKKDPELGPPNLATRQSNLERSIRRSKAQVRRKVLAGKLDHLLTLTYRDNRQNARKSYQDLKRFIRLVRKRYPGWAYLAVHEFQKRGAVHFHLAVRGFQDVRFLRNQWLAVVGQGNIDVQASGRRGAGIWKLPKLALYLSKYIMKNATEANGRQRYRVSEGIELPRDTFIITVPIGTSIVREIFESFGVDLGYQWEDPVGGFGWACSWS